MILSPLLEIFMDNFMIYLSY